MKETNQTGHNMTKNAYEIRLDVLKMAQDMLEAKQKKELTEFEVNARSQDVAMQQRASSMQLSSYTTADVVAEAKSLYDFINSKETK